MEQTQNRTVAFYKCEYEKSSDNPVLTIESDTKLEAKAKSKHRKTLS